MRAAAAKIPHTRRRLMPRRSLDPYVDARLTSGGVPEKLRCSQPMPRPAEPWFNAGCAILSAQYDGLFLEVQLTCGELRRLPLARPNYGRRTEYTAKITVETAPYIEDSRARGLFPDFRG